MKLSRETGRDCPVTTRAELERALEDLGRSPDAFAVLERDDGAFAQAAGSHARGFVFEVREGESHLQSRRGDLSRDEVLALFAAWLEGDDRWRTGVVEWVPRSEEPAAGAEQGWIPLKQRHALFVLAVAVLLAGGAEWQRRRAEDLAAHLQRTTGEVVSVTLKGTSKRYVTARFTADGRSWTLEERTYDQPKVGARVPVWFDPRHPAGTGSLLPGGRWSIAVALYVAAALVALFALKMSRDISRRERREAAASTTGSPPRGEVRNRMMRG